MSTWPKVSVTVITFNHEAYIAEALDSVLAQQYPGDIEIIVRDDCSTDNAPVIIRQYAERYSNITPVLLEKNTYQQGIEPMAAACKYAAGEYIFFLEGDDFWTDPNKIFEQVMSMVEASVEISFHPMQMQRYNILQQTGDEYLAGHGNEKRMFTLNEVISGGPMFMSIAGIAVRASVLKSLPNWFFDGLPFGDYFLQVLCSRNTGALYLPKPMGRYRFMSPGSWTASQKQLSEASLSKHYYLLQKGMGNLHNEFVGHLQNAVIKIWVSETINCAIKAINNNHRLLALSFLKQAFKISFFSHAIAKLKIILRFIVNK